MSKALDDVKAERQRQIEVEEWTPEHDNSHIHGEMAAAGSVYALTAVLQINKEQIECAPDFWPWHRAWFKPKSPRQDLVRAAALLVAEIERLDRLEGIE